MQLKIYISIFSCIFFFSAFSQLPDTLNSVEVLAKKDCILKLTVINSTVPHYILDKNKLNEISAEDIGDAIKFIPGTYIKDYGGIGGLKTVSYRSLGASHTNVEVDGVILPNTQTTTVNLSGFDVFSVNKLEMSSGQVQNHYSTASSYVKSNLISIHSSLFEIPKSKYNLKILSQLSSIHAYQGGLFYQQKLDSNLSIGLQTIYAFGSGQYNYSIQNIDSTYSAERQNSDLQNFKIKGAINYQKKNLKIHFNSAYKYNSQQLPGAVVLYNPYNNQHLQDKKYNSTFSLHYKFKKYAFGLNSFYQNSLLTYRDNQFLNQQGFLENSYQNTGSGGGFIINRFLKTETQKIFIGSDLKLASLKGKQFTSTPFRTSVNSVVGFSKWFWRFKTQGNISHQYIHDNTPDGTKILSHFSPFISLSFLPFEKSNFRIRTHYKNTYRLPSFNDLYYNFIGNINLKAENAESFNLGITYGKKIKSFSTETTLDLYQNNIRDKIVAIPTQNLFNWSMQNIGQVLSRGVDFNLLVAYKKDKIKLTFSSSQSFNKSIDITTINGLTYGHQIPYTPKYTASYTTTISIDKINFTTTVLHTGSRYVINENLPFNKLDGFLDLGFGISRTFKFKNQKIYGNFQVANILNKNYEVIRSFPMPGRYLKLKLVYSLNK